MSEKLPLYTTLRHGLSVRYSYAYTDRLQFPDDQYVEDEYQHEWYGEAEDERVERERGLAAEQLVLGPYDVAALHVALVHGAGVHDHRYHEYDAERPRGDGHDLGHVRGAHLGRRYRMAYGDVPVRAHDHQEYAAGELVHAGRGHVHLAHDVAERPEIHGHGDDQERYADQETLVGNGQVHDVHVGHRLHLGEPDHHVDDQRVAHQPDDAHDYVQDLGYQVQRRLVAGRVAAVHRVPVAGTVVRAHRVRAVVPAARRRLYGRPTGRGQLHDAREFHRRPIDERRARVRPSRRLGASVWRPRYPRPPWSLVVVPVAFLHIVIVVVVRLRNEKQG